MLKREDLSPFRGLGGSNILSCGSQITKATASHVFTKNYEKLNRWISILNEFFFTIGFSANYFHFFIASSHFNTIFAYSLLARAVNYSSGSIESSLAARSIESFNSLDFSFLVERFFLLMLPRERQRETSFCGALLRASSE